MKYLPFLDGKYSTAPALNVLARADAQDQHVFQLDDQYQAYMDNKLSCRQESVQKYYHEATLPGTTSAAINRLIVNLLTQEHPANFSLSEDNGRFTFHNKSTSQTLYWQEDWTAIEHEDYISLFDALCSQVQEDIAICQLEDDKDWLAAIHLSAPNHWAPADKIGRPFSAVHAIVPGMEKLNQQYFKMLLMAVQKGPFFRFAWGIATDTRLNHHPIPPPGIDPVFWEGRRVEADSSKIYLRVERQTIVGLPTSNAFLFTIRTYFYDIDELTAEEKSALFRAVESMSPQSLEYKGLTNKVEILRERLL